MLFISLPIAARAGIIGVVCVVLWLTEWLPLWAPTLVLWISIPLFLSDGGAAYGPLETLRASADPVLLLFLCGFTISAAARRWRLDEWIVSRSVRLSGGRPRRLIVIAAAVTVGLAMWMSNVAAAALVFGAMQPVLKSKDVSPAFRRALLLAITLSADFAGIATPVGSGPNGIAMAAVERVHRIDFLEWMTFGVPVTVALVAIVVALALVRIRKMERMDVSFAPAGALSRGARILCTIVAITILLWMTEGIHRWPASAVAVGAMLAIVAFGLLRPSDVRQIDWTTLILIAGGIGLGRLLDRAGTIRHFADWIPLEAMPHVGSLFILCLISASLSSVMSNTGTATLLIPLAATIDASPSTAILIAVSASLGVPFVISTPPNAMAVANGLHSRDLLVPGLLLLIGGCIAVALTGPWVLHAVGIP
jgi:solute carrier family 13 (sodium-dependent dicarboxylate transporter), member 2/3/5